MVAVSRLVRDPFTPIALPLPPNLSQLEFIADDVETVIKNALQVTLGSSPWNPSKVNSWTSQIVEHCLKSLTAHNKRFKYVVTCVMQQRVGAGMHTAMAAHWDGRCDRHAKVPYDNGQIECICTVYGLGISPTKGSTD